MFKRYNFKTCGSIISIAILMIAVGCKKTVTVADPITTITTNQTFSSDQTAVQAVASIYNYLYNSNIINNLQFGNGAVTLFAGLSSDELAFYVQTATAQVQFQNNALLPDNSLLSTKLWNPAYAVIYQCNAAIEGLQSTSSNVSAATKTQLIAEAKFIRAYVHFYLTNLFGDIPLMVSTDYNTNRLITKATQAKVYEQIINDLTEAQNNLPTDFTPYGNYRNRATKDAATALLARLYLYQGNWAAAETQSSTLIAASPRLSLVTTGLQNVFAKNSTEAILQLQVDSTVNPFAPVEGNQVIPPATTVAPTYILTAGMVNSFELNDQRKAKWTNNYAYTTGGVTTTYYYPFKYNLYSGTSGNVLQYYMVLRLAEQYLIRAEARAQQNTNLAGAIGDLNTLRARAGLLPLLTTLTQTQTLAAVAQERKVELFAEWGHRWLDLKRTGQAVSVLTPIKTGFTATAQLYPIPVGEISANPNLIQNVGY